MSPRSLLLLLLGAALSSALATGCGSSGTGNTSTGGTGGHTGGATSTTTTSTSATATGTGGATGTTSSSGTGGTGGTQEPCSDFVVTPPTQQPVTVRVMNGTGTDLYLGPSQVTCSVYVGFDLTDASGAAIKPNKGHCEFSCADMELGHCACTPNCAVPDIIKIGAGKRYDIHWPRTIFDPAQMPAACYDKTCTASTCFLEKAAQAPLTLKVSGWTAFNCPGGSCTDCTPDSSGTCSVSGADHTTGTEHPATVTWNDDAMVTLTLQ